MSASKLAEQALQRWQAGPEDESVVDAMCDFAQKQMDEMALRVFEDTRERAAKLVRELGNHSHPGLLKCSSDLACNTCIIAKAIRAMQPDRK